MKNIHFLLIIFLLSFFNLPLNAQQQGFGYMKNKQLISFSGIENANKINVSPIVDILPVFGKKARKKGNDLSLPFGIGIYSIYYDQEYMASNLRRRLTPHQLQQEPILFIKTLQLTNGEFS